MKNEMIANSMGCNKYLTRSFLEGKTRSYQFNPRYPFLQELKDFLTKAYKFLPQSQKGKYS